MPKKILLLSPYDVASHYYWREGLVESLSEYEWTILSLEPRYFAWRMRGNSLIWAYEQRQLLEQSYDLLIACSMTDLSSLRGFIPSLANIPTLIYCHENQFYYPHNAQQQGKLEQQIIQLYSFECADKIIFNSSFNKNSCLAGIQALLKKLPDHVPKDLFNHIKNKSDVLPVPLQEEVSLQIEKAPEFTITWNHRWEYDKGIQQLYYLIERIIASGIDCQINILGQSFRQIPETMQACIALLENSKCRGHIGFIKDRQEYLKLLSKSHVVLSTSLHEFQGLAIMEAVYLHCLPLLPKRLSYPEFFPAAYLYESFENDPEKESEALMTKLLEYYANWKNEGNQKQAELIESIPTWKNKKAAYQLLFQALIRG